MLCLSVRQFEILDLLANLKYTHREAINIGKIILNMPQSQGSKCTDTSRNARSPLNITLFDCSSNRKYQTDQQKQARKEYPHFMARDLPLNECPIQLPCLHSQLQALPLAF
jgi:hypothetical protein